MTVHPTDGRRQLCGRRVSPSPVTVHLKTCLPASNPSSRGGPEASFIVFVQGRYASDYWMAVRVPADACLDELDSFLRRIWLECCGHLSAFTISGMRYTFSPEGIYGDTPRDAPIRQIVLSRKVFRYEYDFGTPTGLNLRVTASLRHGERAEWIELLARNDPPEILCDRCGTRPPLANSPRAGVCGYGG